MKQDNKKELQKLVKVFHTQYGNMFPIPLKEMLDNIGAVHEGLSWSWNGFSVTSDLANKKLKVGDCNPLYSVVRLGTGINEHGITGPDDVGRTYSLKLEITGIKRLTQRTKDNDGIFFILYNYGRTIKELMSKIETKMQELQEVIKKENIKFEYIAHRNLKF